MSLYSNRVSFSNVHPTYINPTKPRCYPTANYNSLYQYLNESAQIPQTSSSALGSKRRLSSHHTLTPPHKSILKNKNDPKNIATVATTTVATSGADTADSDIAHSSSLQQQQQQQQQPFRNSAFRKKSLVEMTDEEILQLDKQFTQASKFNEFDKNFNFNINDDYSINKYLKPTDNINNKHSPSEYARLDDLFNNGYPTSPILYNNSANLVKEHKHFNENHASSSSSNTVLIVLANNVSSLLSIDFYLKKLAKDNDTVVIISCIEIDEFDQVVPKSPSLTPSPHNFITNLNASTSSKTSDGVPLTPVHNDDNIYNNGTKTYSVDSPQALKYLNELFKYIESQIKLFQLEKLKLKFNLELLNTVIQDKEKDKDKDNKDILKNVIDLYNPHYCVISNSPINLDSLIDQDLEYATFNFSSYYIQKNNNFPLLAVDIEISKNKTSKVFKRANSMTTTDHTTSTLAATPAIQIEVDSDSDSESIDSNDMAIGSSDSDSVSSLELPKSKTTKLEIKLSDIQIMLSNTIFMKLTNFENYLFNSKLISKFYLELSNLTNHSERSKTNDTTYSDLSKSNSANQPKRRVKSLLPPLEPASTSTSSVSNGNSISNSTQQLSPTVTFSNYTLSPNDSSRMSIVEKYNRRMSMNQQQQQQQQQQQHAPTQTPTQTPTQPRRDSMTMSLEVPTEPRRKSDGYTGSTSMSATSSSPPSTNGIIKFFRRSSISNTKKK